MKTKSFIDYDVENTFDEDAGMADEQQIEKLLAVGKVKCVYATKTIQSGDQLEVEIYPEFSRSQIKKDKSIKKKTRKAQKNLNDKNARKQLIRLTNCNFGDGDIWATFTYANEYLPQAMEEAQKNMKNFIRRIKRRRKKLELPDAKYIYVTEWSASKKKKIRCHHHLIIDGAMSMDELEALWKHGRRNNTRRIKKDVNGLTGLAEYISKDPQGSKRWCASKNLKKPIIRKNHRDFSLKKIRQMIANNNLIRGFIEKKYPGMIYLKEQARFNEINGRTYFYIQLAIPEEKTKPKRE